MMMTVNETDDCGTDGYDGNNDDGNEDNDNDDDGRWK